MVLHDPYSLFRILLIKWLELRLNPSWVLILKVIGLNKKSLTILHKAAHQAYVSLALLMIVISWSLLGKVPDVMMYFNVQPLIF